MGLNDPQWGRRGSGGPPDLDELWRRFNQKLNAIFGRRGDGGGSEPPQGGGPGMRQIRGGAGLLAALLVAVWAASGFYIVDESQRGVVLRFGKYVETTMPGPRWHIPYPMESVDIVNISQVRTLELGYRNNVKSKVLKESLMLTDDENIIDVQYAVQYVLKNPEAFLFNNRSPDEAVKQVAEAAMSEVVGSSTMDFVLYEGRAEVATGASARMQELLDTYGTGIQISSVTMQNAQPPEQVQAAFDDAVKASQDRERLINEAQAYANDVIPKARGNASRVMQEAEGYRSRVIATAEGDASRFLQILPEYNKAPGVTRERMYLDTMQQVLSSTGKVLVDQRGSNLLYLPLDKLMQGAAMGQATVEPSPAAAKPAPAEAAPEGTGRSREAFRGREREQRP